MPFLGPAIEKAPRAVIFDIGRVIIQVDMARCPTGALESRAALDHTQVLRELEADPRWPDWQEGRMSPHDWHAHLARKLGIFLRLRRILRDLEQRPPCPSRSFRMRCSNGSQKNAAWLCSPIPIPSTWHISKRTTRLCAFSPRAFTPRHVGSSKPSPMIYHHALREVDALPDEAMFIDDLREKRPRRGQLLRDQRFPFHFSGRFAHRVFEVGPLVTGFSLLRL